MKDFKMLEPGDAILDMHDGITGPNGQSRLRINDPVDVLDWITMPSEMGAKMIEATVSEYLGTPYQYLNKMLVVVEAGMVRNTITAAYSYDGRTFGLIKIKKSATS